LEIIKNIDEQCWSLHHPQILYLNKKTEEEILFGFKSAALKTLTYFRTQNRVKDNTSNNSFTLNVCF